MTEREYPGTLFARGEEREMAIPIPADLHDQAMERGVVLSAEVLPTGDNAFYAHADGQDPEEDGEFIEVVSYGAQSTGDSDVLRNAAIYVIRQAIEFEGADQ